ncbi:MAG: SDR family NAD(P)-dependent oxidoreductase, partial [Acidimicrobiales bacterium]
MSGGSDVGPPGRQRRGARVGLLEGKVALVSGAGPGLGRDVALAFGREGATVVVAARTEDKVQALAAEVEGHGAKALG